MLACVCECVHGGKGVWIGPMSWYKLNEEEEGSICEEEAEEKSEIRK